VRDRFFVICAIRYVKYWHQIKEAFLQSGIPWPFPSQRAFNQEMRINYFGAYRKMFLSVVGAGRIIFLTRTDNPIILQPLRGIRRCLLTFVIFPFILAFVLLVISVSIVGS